MEAARGTSNDLLVRTGGGEIINDEVGRKSSEEYITSYTHRLAEDDSIHFLGLVYGFAPGIQNGLRRTFVLKKTRNKPFACTSLIMASMGFLAKGGLVKINDKRIAGVTKLLLSGWKIEASSLVNNSWTISKVIARKTYSFEVRGVTRMQEKENKSLEFSGELVLIGPAFISFLYDRSLVSVSRDTHLTIANPGTDAKVLKTRKVKSDTESVTENNDSDERLPASALSIYVSAKSLKRMSPIPKYKYVIARVPALEIVIVSCSLSIGRGFLLVREGIVFLKGWNVEFAPQDVQLPFVFSKEISGRVHELTMSTVESDKRGFCSDHAIYGRILILSCESLDETDVKEENICSRSSLASVRAAIPCTNYARAVSRGRSLKALAAPKGLDSRMAKNSVTGETWAPLIVRENSRARACLSDKEFPQVCDEINSPGLGVTIEGVGMTISEHKITSASKILLVGWSSQHQHDLGYYHFVRVFRRRKFHLWISGVSSIETSKHQTYELKGKLKVEFKDFVRCMQYQKLCDDDIDITPIASSDGVSIVQIRSRQVEEPKSTHVPLRVYVYGSASSCEHGPAMFGFGVVKVPLLGITIVAQRTIITQGVLVVEEGFIFFKDWKIEFGPERGIPWRLFKEVAGKVVQIEALNGARFDGPWPIWPLVLGGETVTLRSESLCDLDIIEAEPY